MDDEQNVPTASQAGSSHRERWYSPGPMGLKRRSATRGRLFTDDSIQFLVDLEQNNDRDWFNANKMRYEELIREPALELVRRMAPHLAKVSKYFEASDKKVGGSLMRIHRDTRFSKDKTPYKTNVGIHFRHRADKDVHGPGLYIHIALDGCFIGVGSWRPASEALAGIRRRIVEKPKQWKAARDDKTFRRYFELGGDSLKRMPRGFSEDEPFAEDLRRKDHTASAELDLSHVLGPNLVEYCATRFAAAKPYARFLTRAVNAPF